MTILKGVFDVHIDSNHRWDTDQVMEIDAYPIRLLDDGTSETNMNKAIASVRIPAFDISMDVWIDSSETEDISALPPLVRDAYAAVVALAIAVEQKKR